VVAARWAMFQACLSWVAGCGMRPGPGSLFRTAGSRISRHPRTAEVEGGASCRRRS
jgi:hypothetical protein